MRRGYDYYIAEARRTEARSRGLWGAMNQVVRTVLETQRKKGVLLGKVPAILEHIAGPRKERQGDMVSIENIRIAARQIRARGKLCLL